MEIRLTQNKFALIDARDFKKVGQYKWHASCHKNKHRKLWYANTMANTGYLAMHRLILGARRGEFVDHKNGNGLDNRRNNIRKCTRSQNQWNRGKASNRQGQGKYKNIHLNKSTGRWYISFNPGTFDTEEQALRMWKKLAKICFGKFARFQ